MPIDFKASQIRTNKLIASGSGDNPKLLIYSKGAASDDEGGLSQYFATGSDSWLYISGAINEDEKVVFGGDSIVSGTLIVDPQPLESLFGAFVNSNPNLSRIGIKNNAPETTLHVGGSPDPGLLVDTGAIINYGRNNSSSATFLVQGKSSGDHGLLVVSGCCDRVSIGKHNPNAKLDVYGDSIISGSLHVTSSLVSRNITGSIRYVDEAMTTEFLVGGATYNNATGQWTISGGGGGGGDSYFSSTTLNSIYTTGSAAFVGNESIDSPSDKGSDLFFYISGSIGDGTNRSLFGGDVITSGSLDVRFNSTFGSSAADLFTINASLNSNIIPMFDSFFTLGSPTNRFAHVYTGDLHLRNDRGDWTMIEEEEFLTLRNNKTGKRYKLSMTPLDD